MPMLVMPMLVMSHPCSALVVPSELHSTCFVEMLGADLSSASSAQLGPPSPLPPFPPFYTTREPKLYKLTLLSSQNGAY